MLSKCLNSRCSATFQYLTQGRLFRIDFTEAGRRHALAGQKTVACIRSKSCPREHFWLCENCAKTMTIELGDDGEVCLVPIEIPLRKATVVTAWQTLKKREATAS